MPADAIEGFAAALLALIHAVAADDPAGDVELLLGVEWRPDQQGPASRERLEFAPHITSRSDGTFTAPLGGSYRPVYRLVDATPDDKSFINTAIDVATDCLNQAGFAKPFTLDPMLPPRR